MSALDELLAGRELTDGDRERLRGALRDLLGESEPAAEPRAMMFESLEAWLEDFWLPLYTRALSPSRVWCPRWFEHAEARSRLTGLWYAWEAIADRSSRAALSDWWRDHADYQMRALMDPTGPFQGCSPSAHSEHARPRLGNGDEAAGAAVDLGPAPDAVYVVELADDEPAVFSREGDANAYAGERGGTVFRVLVCDGKLAARMIAEARQ